MNDLSSNPQSTGNGPMTSLDSMEGLETSAPQWYDFRYRDHVLRIGTESAGAGKVRYMVNHPTGRDSANRRPARVRRSSQADIEMEARRIIDQLLNSRAPLAPEQSDLSTVSAQPPGTIDGSVSAPGLPLELPIESLSQLRPGDSPQGENASHPAAEKPMETVPANDGSALAAVEIIESQFLPAAAQEITPDLRPSESSHDAIGPALNSELKSPRNGNEVGPSRTPRRRASRLVWPSDADFLEMLWTKRGTQIARQLNRSAETVLHMADKLGLPRPNPNHWLKQKYGEVMEIPEHIKKRIAELRQAGASSTKTNKH